MNARTFTRRLLISLPMLLLAACEEDSDGPPKADYGNSVCVECSMILSDERFAAATVVEGPRGPAALLFDDYNCQIIHERTNPGLVVLDRWAHDHGTREWVRTDQAYFVHSPRLRTPMASNAAAFAAEPDAVSAAAELGGVVLRYADLHSAMNPEPCCASDENPAHDGPGSEPEACCGGCKADTP